MAQSLHNRMKRLVVTGCLAICWTSSVAAQQTNRNLANHRPKLYRADLNAAYAAGVAPQTTPTPTTLEVVIMDTVAYVGDVPYDKLMTSSLGKAIAPKITASVIAIGDVRQINGRQVGGMYVNCAFPVFSTPFPSPENGFSISDSTRLAGVAQILDLQTADGTSIGGIYGFGLAFGTPSPGAPPNAGAGNVAIIGGTGPYVGIHGQMYTTVDTQVQGPTPSVRFTSGEESPAMRRVNRGGTTKFLLQLYPAFSPDAVAFDEGPAVFHRSDQSLVTQWNPAQPGEVLTALVRNMGPTKGPNEPGQPFMQGKNNDVNSPVEIQVNGQAAEVKAAAGVPGAVNVYEVEFTVPGKTPSGPAAAQVFVGFIGGARFPLYVQ